MHPHLREELARLGLPARPSTLSGAALDRLLAAFEARCAAHDEERRSLEASLGVLYAELARLGDGLRQASEPRLAAERRLLLTVLNAIADGLFVLGADGHVRLANPAAERLLGWSAAELAGTPLFARLLPAEATVPDLAALLAGGGCVQDDEALLLTREGERLPVAYMLVPFVDETGTPGAVWVFRDVSAQRALTAALSHRASHDPLTGLINRTEFEARLGRLLGDRRGGQRPHALFYLDLDRFKPVNDGAGHVAGDALLRQLALLFGRQLRTSDTLARLGGDEFGVLLEGCPLPQALRIAEKLVAAVTAFRFHWGAQVFELGVSVGVVALDGSCSEIAHALARADAACYAAKDAGRGRVHVFVPGDESRDDGYAGWLERVQHALAEGRLQLLVQAIVPLAAAAATPLHEVLLRIEEHGALLPPGAFLPAAGRGGLGAELDRAVLRRTLTRLRGPGPAPAGRYALNLGAATLCDPGFAAFVGAELASSGVDGTRLCFELPAADALSHWDRACALADALHALGCAIALDDVGGGLPSPVQLAALRLDFLKIDGPLIRGLVGDPLDAAMVGAILQLADALGVATVAEQVETAELLARVRARGFTLAQGHALEVPRAWA